MILIPSQKYIIWYFHAEILYSNTIVHSLSMNLLMDICNVIVLCQVLSLCIHLLIEGLVFYYRRWILDCLLPSINLRSLSCGIKGMCFALNGVCSFWMAPLSNGFACFILEPSLPCPDYSISRPSSTCGYSNFKECRSNEVPLTLPRLLSKSDQLQV